LPLTANRSAGLQIMNMTYDELITLMILIAFVGLIMITVAA
jgi:hypothetical protein